MRDAPEFDPITVPARWFAQAWRAVWNAAGVSPDFYDTYRAVAVEVFPQRGVRLVCNNDRHSFLAHVWVPALEAYDDDGATEDEPAPDDLPVETVVVRDVRKLACQMMADLVSDKGTKPDDDGGPVVALVVQPGRIIPDTPSQPTLGAAFNGMFDQWGIVFTAPRQKVSLEALPQMDTFPQQWRHVDEIAVPASMDEAGFHPDDLAAVAKVPSSTPIAWTSECTPTGRRLIRLRWYTIELGEVHGILAPVQTAEPVPPTPDDDARADADEVVARGRAARRPREELTATITEREASALAEADVNLLPRGDYRPDEDGHELIVNADDPFDSGAAWDMADPPFDNDGETESWFDEIGTSAPKEYDKRKGAQ